MSYYGFPEYVSVQEKKDKANRAIAALKKKNPDVAPIIIEGNILAKSWWGKAWNKNLENYADYSNRIGRGRSYIRQNCVLLRCYGDQNRAEKSDCQKPVKRSGVSRLPNSSTLNTIDPVNEYRHSP